MPPLPVITDVFRVTWNYLLDGQPIAHNVIHFKSDATSETELSDAIKSSLDDHYTNMFALLPSDLSMTGWDILALDGSSASVHKEIGNHGGQADGQGLPNTAAVIKLGTGFRGRSHRGRIYLGPVAESMINTGFLDADGVGTTTDGWRSFQDDLIAGTTPHCAMQVVSLKLETSELVESIDCQNLAGTQRRRQERLG